MLREHEAELVLGGSLLSNVRNRDARESEDRRQIRGTTAAAQVSLKLMVREAIGEVYCEAIRKLNSN